MLNDDPIDSGETLDKSEISLSVAPVGIGHCHLPDQFITGQGRGGEEPFDGDVSRRCARRVRVVPWPVRHKRFAIVQNPAP